MKFKNVIFNLDMYLRIKYKFPKYKESGRYGLNWITFFFNKRIRDIRRQAQLKLAI